MVHGSRLPNLCSSVQQTRDGKQSRALRTASAPDGELCLEVKGWWLMHLLDRAPPGEGQVQVRPSLIVCFSDGCALC